MNSFDWSAGDYAMAAVLLLTPWLIWRFLILGRFRGRARWFALALVVLVVVLVWMELAVGLFGSPWAGT
jgi:hypothetical protein